MKFLAVGACLLALTGCASLGQRESSVTLPAGDVYKVRCQSDGALKYRNGEVSIEVDNRGRQGLFESVFGTMALGFARAPEVIAK